MMAVKNVGGTSLAWVQPQIQKRMFELKAGDDVVATLEWKKLFGSLAEARSPEGEWTFKREGFLNPRVTIRRAGWEDNIAVFKPGWSGDGYVEFTDGRRFKWAHTDFWGTKWALLDAEGRHIADFRHSGGIKSILRYESAVEVSADKKNLPDIALLIAFGWYLMILIAEDSAASAAATTAVM